MQNFGVNKLFGVNNQHLNVCCNNQEMLETNTQFNVLTLRYTVSKLKGSGELQGPAFLPINRVARFSKQKHRMPS